MTKFLTTNSELALDPTTVARSVKEKHILSLTEDTFRDLVVRPLFERRGLRCISETCGVDEQGKDSIFRTTDPFDRELYYAVQTKKGPINMSRDATENVIVAQTQVKTALETDIIILATKQKMRPDFVFLCASGKINQAARNHIVEYVKDTRLVFRDIDDFIEDIDKLYPEFWYGVDANKFPYLRRLKAEIIAQTDIISVSEFGQHDRPQTPIADENFVQLYLTKITTKVEQSRGQVTQKPEIKQYKVSSILEQTDRMMLIVGEGGSGKTTVLRRIAYSIIQKALSNASAVDVPILIKAAEVARSDQRLVDFVGATTARVTGENKVCFSATDLANGNVILLIDALDEVPNDDARNRVLDKLNEFHLQFPKCPVMLSSRDYQFLRNNHRLISFSRYDLTPIDLHQVNQIVDRVAEGRVVPKEKAKEMLRRLQDVHGVTLNPLIVTVFVATSDFTKKDIPPNITEIFNKMTELMLGRWDEKKALSQQYVPQLKDFLLQRVAFSMHSHRVTQLSLETFRSLIADELRRRGYSSDVDALFDEIVYRSGLLRVQDESIEFRIHLLQEYFAGRGAQEAESFGAFVADEWWRNPIVFYFGDNPTKVGELMRLAKSVEGSPFSDIFEAAVTIGLAIQACYLAEIDQKVTGLEWVVNSFSGTCEEYTEHIEHSWKSFPVSSFIMSYLHGRDSVASDQIVDVANKINNEMLDEKHPDAKHQKSQWEMRMFWALVGLIEAGHLELAEEIARRFRPTDQRLLLAVHFGCIMASEVRVSTGEQKKAARRITADIGSRIGPLLQQAAREFTGTLLEMRRGKVSVVSLESPQREETSE